ncbi:probable trehalose-phosphate phosphatase D isoform X2 [Humulus lupulus]|uniref:probable trehalose-phosphate phosphatase D isoform X2 n=1 Tax=Humulus lupulus TaxID=3486 RepID=UPI002B4068F0|nr:probable trehalose-phosphate phosphatase D isoform X2 [Humulus lupulus]
MGLQKPPSNKQKTQQPNTNPKNDENDGVDCFVASNHNITPIITTPISSADSLTYNSWLMRTAVREVAKYFPTAIISGRSRDKVKEFVQLSNIYYAGSHGMDIMAPAKPLKSSDANNSMDNKGNDVPFQPAEKYLPQIREILKLLEEQTKTIIGSTVEDNRFCISVHYRRVRDEDFGKLNEIVESLLKKYPDFHLTNGKKVMEIRPSIKWNKGNALVYLLGTLGFSNSSEVLPLYIGDDRTDEDAFQVIRDRGQGFPIIVSSTPKETKALNSLHDPSEVLAFLSRLARWRKGSSAK